MNMQLNNLHRERIRYSVYIDDMFAAARSMIIFLASIPVLCLFGVLAGTALKYFVWSAE